MIPSGISEDIYVQFTPNDEYKYFYDSIRIHCEGDKILIPIHAFPVINTKKDALLPKQIDMGRNLKVGSHHMKNVDIESNCPVNFEYEIKETKGHPDIRVTPMSGDIIGNSITQITFIYVPGTFTTAEAEFEVRTSEFDFSPQVVRIVGSALPQNMNVQTMGAGEEESTVIKRLLTDKSSRPAKLEKIPESTLKKTMANTEKAQQSGLKSTMKLTEDEKNFLHEFRRLEDLEREKGIKFFECIGDPPATEEFVNGIENKRNNNIENKLAVMRTQDCHRFATEVNRDKVVVPSVV